MAEAVSSKTLTVSAPQTDRHFQQFMQDDLMVWSEEFSVGVGRIDAEHQDLFDAINDLHIAVLGHEDRVSIHSLLVRVAEGTRAHFISEEGLMGSVKYNGKALHALKHQRLMEQIDGLVARFNRGIDLDERSLLFIRDWFIPHILEIDKNFGFWYSEHCLS